MKNMLKQCILISFGVSLCGSALADRLLDRSEILQILQQLTSQSKATWISSGTIEAIHEEYHAPKIQDDQQIEQLITQAQQDYQAKADKIEMDSNLQDMKLKAIPFNIRYKYNNEYTMTSKVTVKYNGSKFYWDIDVLFRTDTIRPPLEHTFMYEYFNVDWNRRRIFSWDGEKYTRYTPSANIASVTEKLTDIPVEVNGPLTAGIIPWGQGQLSYDNLVNVGEITCKETDNNGPVSILMNIILPNQKEVSLVLDPAKNYAVYNCTIIRPDKPMQIQSLSDYQLISEQWVPKTIVLESYDSTGRLLTGDTWRLTAINTELPSDQEFSVDFADDAMIEFTNTITDKPVMYLSSTPQASNGNIDSTSLLAMKLDIAANSESHNCATAAMEYVTQQLGYSVTGMQLSSLINPSDQSTSLYALKQFAQNIGLHAYAAVMDINALKQLTDCQIILHFPGKNHYVVFGNIDDRCIRVVDLTKKKFYYGIDLTQIHLDWENGVVLVLSKNPIILPDHTTVISDSSLNTIVGIACETGYYSCTNLLQEYFVIFCPVTCDGLYRIYVERWGCICDDSGSCSSQFLLRVSTTPCYEDGWGVCTVTGEWTQYLMRACM